MLPDASVRYISPPALLIRGSVKTTLRVESVGVARKHKYLLSSRLNLA